VEYEQSEARAEQAEKRVEQSSEQDLEKMSRAERGSWSGNGVVSGDHTNGH